MPYFQEHDDELLLVVGMELVISGLTILRIGEQFREMNEAIYTKSNIPNHFEQ